ncbi:MAG: response regulator [Brasilonema octagenarum HA4186-MV1]|jgi:signal transduction histidine kinase|uniref:histidine kinase n=1 Tax=Brasilonema sennae CENA114 TaxID=415709 RepID=A0A856MEV7_9CYAN|nr:response regulator [Brasilonema sennae]MBW4626359.1 response regulator [Brasilonema octagenarum HA4186-MV1]QDL08820.1 hybrid sensor histidine kinase/response regulator [Brasilonema sennae CENA114]QDL15177.1 hybrid sensor histidine kinase/response regulator [Brasilonema octagenarum UFV-E1]
MHRNQGQEYKGNILVVDDTPDNLRLLSAMLTAQGYEVRKALNGKMGLMACQMVLPDVILLDINMPGVNGYELCQQLKDDERTCEVPVIFISALDDVLDKVKAFDVGGVDYITKPFSVAEVILRIENQINLRLLEIKLQEKNLLLQNALDDLKAAQVKQIQNEKMVALGQLVAGIAHEVNNPISFIYGNLEYVGQYMQELVGVISLYQQEYPHSTPKIEQIVQEIDLNFLMCDLKNLLGAMNRGADRIRHIVLALQKFSRVDEAQMKSVNIHEGIDSTLVMLQHRLKETTYRCPIVVVKEYDDNLPPVTCYASELNQVFLHILNNAIDALESTQAHSKWKMSSCSGGQMNTSLSSASHPKFHRIGEDEHKLCDQDICQWEDGQKIRPLHFTNSPTHDVSSTICPPVIRIRTELADDNTVKISITDNGFGMDESVRSRTFDPFFTTKPVGKGSGLGLAISHQIVVQKHQGQISCNSLPGEGAEFIIEIPVKHPNT